jgi:type VII secretion protein EccB
MPSTPTTKSQVQAYRFVLRRMESALVRKDPVMLHDPMRSHKRATVVGAIVGVVGIVAFLLVGVLNPAPAIPSTGIVIAQPSGSIYVVSQNPHQLIPVFNLASARLLIAAAAQSQQNQAGGAAPATGSAPQLVNPTTVDDSQLKNMPIGRMTGIPDGPTMLPAPNQSPTTWAVCDNIARDVNAFNQTGHTAPTTTVLVGQSSLGANLTTGQALLVSDDGGATLDLVYGLSGTSDHANDGAVRARIDTADQAVLTALNIDRNAYRVVSSAVLNAIPSVSEIQNPTIGLNTTAPVVPALAGAGIRLGESFEVQQVGQAPQYFIAVPGGRQQVSETTAQIARFEYSAGQNQIPLVRPDAVDPVPRVTPGSGGGLQVNVSDYPGPLPAVISADNKPAMCLAWSADYADPQKPVAKTRVTVDYTIDLPTDPATGQPMRSVPIGQGTSSGRINSFFMNPALGGAAIRAATNAGEFASGPILVVDPRGVAFSVPDTTTAQVLGIADNTASGGLAPAPQSIVGLLPLGGSSLSVQAVQRTFDAMSPAPNVGQFIQPGQTGGS